MSTNNDGKSFFARYVEDLKKERLEPEKIRIGPRSPPIEKLRDWLVNHWTKPTVTAREIYIYGPNSVRDWKSTINLAEILVEQGCLVPIETRRRDMKKWQIKRILNCA